ncbi:hypothetical protein [Bifidobacterium samirii]|uniref:hypothetical protein n=1 Tax=Bifidobacterium samirii TaxID=2306974 RepID=UPI003B978A6C
MMAVQRTSPCMLSTCFPSNYWRFWTRVDSVRFVITMSGISRVLLCQSKRTLPAAAHLCGVQADADQ